MINDMIDNDMIDFEFDGTMCVIRQCRSIAYVSYTYGDCRHMYGALTHHRTIHMYNHYRYWNTTKLLLLLLLELSFFRVISKSPH